MFREFKQIFINLLKPPQIQNEIDWLDGYRGYLAMIVILQHFCTTFKIINYEYYKFFDGPGVFIGIIGFFVLTAFLLTYHLLIDFDQAPNYRISLLRVVQYAIRRFFRLYLVFIIFFQINIQISKFAKKYLHALQSKPIVPYLDGIILYSTEQSSLWTIPIEIKYYLLIPVISFFASKSGRFWYIYSMFIAFIIFFIEFQNTSYPDAKAVIYDYSINLTVSMFLKGSLVAIVYYNLKKNENFESYGLIKYVLLTLTFVLFLFQYSFGSRMFNPKVNLKNSVDGYISSYFSALILACLLFNTSNVLTKLFSLRYMRSYGKCSFGIYLCQYLIIKPLNEYKKTFSTYIILLIASLLLCHLVGIIWLFAIENMLIKIADVLCKRLENLTYFRKYSIVQTCSDDDLDESLFEFKTSEV